MINNVENQSGELSLKEIARFVHKEEIVQALSCVRKELCKLSLIIFTEIYRKILEIRCRAFDAVIYEEK